jgi:hypothetical protein
VIQAIQEAGDALGRMGQLFNQTRQVKLLERQQQQENAKAFMESVESLYEKYSAATDPAQAWQEMGPMLKQGLAAYGINAGEINRAFDKLGKVTEENMNPMILMTRALRHSMTSKGTPFDVSADNQIASERASIQKEQAAAGMTTRPAAATATAPTEPAPAPAPAPEREPLGVADYQFPPPAPEIAPGTPAEPVAPPVAPSMVPGEPPAVATKRAEISRGFAAKEEKRQAEIQAIAETLRNSPLMGGRANSLSDLNDIFASNVKPEEWKIIKVEIDNMGPGQMFPPTYIKVMMRFVAEGIIPADRFFPGAK